MHRSTAQIAEAALSAQIGALRDTADLLRAQLDDMRQDRDHWRTQAEATQRPGRRDGQTTVVETARWLNT
jgi:hypothetical protein